MAFTDPPYNVPIDGHATGQGHVHHREFAMASGEMSNAEFPAFSEGRAPEPRAGSSNGALHFVAMDWRHLTEFLKRARTPTQSSRIPLRLVEDQRRHGLTLPHATRADRCL